MINGEIPRGQDIIKNGFDDWVELLEHTGNPEMLKDPYNVWLEAFNVGTLIERHGTLHAIQTQIGYIGLEHYDDRAMLSIEEVKQLQMSMLKQVLTLIASKGLTRPSAQ